MSSISKEAAIVTPDYTFSDIRKVIFTPTVGKPDEITAIITRQAHSDKIDLGTPEQASGRLEILKRNHILWSLTKVGAAVVTIVDGGLRIYGVEGIIPVITGGCEVAAGLVTADHTVSLMQQRSNFLRVINQELNKRIRTQFLGALESPIEPRN